MIRGGGVVTKYSREDTYVQYVVSYKTHACSAVHDVKRCSMYVLYRIQLQLELLRSGGVVRPLGKFEFLC